MPKSWKEKLNKEASPEVKVLDKKFSDIPEGAKMLIATPQIIKAYVEDIPAGSSTDIPTLRNDLAITHHADKTCPVTTGIFLRIVAEAAFEDYLAGKKLTEVTPFWRAINPKTPLAKKLACGTDFLKEQREKEGI